MKKNICSICKRKFSRLRGLSYHKNRAHGNKKAWNKGLTKETDKRIAKAGNIYTARCKNGEIKTWCKGLTKYTDKRIRKLSEKIRKIVNKKIKNGEWHQSFSKRRIHFYKGLKFNGSWEFKYAQWLDSQNIKWRQPKESFSYTFENKEHRYTPDFYLINENCYIEIKGYETEKDRAKWKYFPLKLKVLKGKELKELNIIEEYKDYSK